MQQPHPPRSPATLNAESQPSGEHHHILSETLPTARNQFSQAFEFTALWMEYPLGKQEKVRNMAPQFGVGMERDEAGRNVASVPQLPGCHTDAASLDELMLEIREAIELCLQVQGGSPAPLEFVGIQRLTIAA